jgi:hypothetical protein
MYEMNYLGSAEKQQAYNVQNPNWEKIKKSASFFHDYV